MQIFENCYHLVRIKGILILSGWVGAGKICARSWMLPAAYKHTFLPTWWPISGGRQGLPSTLLGRSTPTAGFSSAAAWNTLWENHHPRLIFIAIRKAQGPSLCSAGWTTASLSPRRLGRTTVLKTQPSGYKLKKVSGKCRIFSPVRETASAVPS